MTEKKKRLVYILHDIAIGGVEVALLSALPRLAEEYELKVIVLGTIDPTLIAHYTIEQKSVFQPFSYPLYTYPLHINTIVKTIVRFKPDYLICSLWRSLMIGVLVKRRYKEVKFFTFIHSVSYFHALSKYFTIQAIKKSDVVLTDSASTFQFVNANFDLKCPVRRVSFMTHPSTTFIERKFPPQNKPISFLFMGRVDKLKNLSAVIKLMAFLRTKGYDVTLDIYGRKENAYTEVSALVAQLDLDSFVMFKGEIEPTKKFNLFSHYDFYIQLSAVEGMAMSVAEAMQSGLPCIVSPVGEIPNYSEDGVSAVFIDIWDEAQWLPSLQKVEEVIKDASLYQRLSKNCWNNFQGRKVYSESLIENIELPNSELE